LDDGTALVLLVQDRVGYANLCRLITRGRLRHEKGKCSVSYADVMEHAPGLLALWGGEQSALVSQTKFDAKVAGQLRDAFGDRIYGLVARHKRAQEPLQEAILRERARQLGLPLVAATEVLYHTAERRRLQDVLACIRQGVVLSAAHTMLKPNAEPARTRGIVRG
jgi:error-prone DNA polymerase